ncbi:MAG: hypothetical protein IT423_05620 [Pirellulaceae bacterium]|nr:hypothetical protein [Pirellulaceae bacterium]
MPDSLAGKTGKCPKCQAALKIPAADGAPAKAASSSASAGAAAQPSAAGQTHAAAKPATKPVAQSAGKATPAAAATAAAAAPIARTAPAARVATAATSAAAVDDLFDEIGLKKKTCPTCPKCGGAIQKTAALCVHCGFHLETGEQAKGYQLQAELDEFKNPFLQEAADNMHREDVSEERHAKSGTPWWMLVSFLLGSLCIGIAGIIIVDATMNEPEPEGTLLGNLQREKFGVVAGVTFGAVGSMIAFFAHTSIAIFGFSKGAGTGFATLLVPFYAFYFGIKTWADNKSGIYGLIIGGVVGGFGFWLNQYCGGVRGYYF